MPGHDGVPVAAGVWGGARGCIQRSKVLMMRMRPPQQGQGGSQSAGSRRFDRLWGRRPHGKQFAGARYIGLACGAGEQAIMADAVGSHVAGHGAGNGG